MKQQWLVLVLLASVGRSSGDPAAAPAPAALPAAVAAAYKQWQSSKDSKDPQPYFDAFNPRSVLVQQNQNTSLPCRVHDLKNQSVAWMRQRDQHIMAVDNITFISDNRFEPELDPGTKTWYLNVYSASVADAGVYECQLSTNPKKSLPIRLHVSVPKVDILGDAEIIVKQNSRVDIKCRIRGTIHKPEKVNWQQNGKRVLGIIYTSEEDEDDPSFNLDSETASNTNKNGISNKDILEDSDSDFGLTPTFVSSLIITSAALADAGNYTCQPDDLTPAKVSLFVISGEQPAAMQHSRASSIKPTRFWPIIATFCTLISVLLSLDLRKKLHDTHCKNRRYSDKCRGKNGLPHLDQHQVDVT